MAITSASRGPQHRLAYRLGSAINPYKFFAIVPDTFKTVAPTAATIAIYGADGVTVKLATVAMTPANPSTYTIVLSNTATFPLGESYQIAHTFTSAMVVYTPPRRVFDIFTDVAESLVTDEDLTELVRQGNDYLGDRSDYSGLVREAWNLLLLDLEQLRRPDGSQLRPLKLADSNVLYKAHLYKALSLLAQELRNADAERFGLLYRDYDQAYNDERERLAARQLEIWGAGPVVSQEPRRNRLRSHVVEFGPTGVTPSDFKDLTPWTRRTTEF